MEMQRPFLKWAGSWSQMIERIDEMLPPGRRLIEPFVGSGAVFLNTDYDNYLLGDNDKTLIDMYLYLQHEGKAFIDYCRSFFTPENNSEFGFYALRKEFGKTTDERRKAALYLYLNRHSRMRATSQGNSRREYPRPLPYFPGQEMLNFHRKARGMNVAFVYESFREVMQWPLPGDVVFCDSTSPGLTLQDQADLGDLALALAEKNIPVLNKGHANEWTMNAYRRWWIR